MAHLRYALRRGVSPRNESPVLPFSPERESIIKFDAKYMSAIFDRAARIIFAIAIKSLSSRFSRSCSKYSSINLSRGDRYVGGAVPFVPRAMEFVLKNMHVIPTTGV